MDEEIELEATVDRSDRFIHQLNKLLIGVAVGFVATELSKAVYDRLINRGKTIVTEN